MKPNNEKGGKKSMYKQSKRFLAGFLAFLLVVTMIPTDLLGVVYAAEETDVIETEAFDSDDDAEEAEVLENADADDDADAEEAPDENDIVKADESAEESKAEGENPPTPSQPESTPTPSQPESTPTPSQPESTPQPSEPVSTTPEPSEPESTPTQPIVQPKNYILNASNVAAQTVSADGLKAGSDNYFTITDKIVIEDNSKKFTINGTETTITRRMKTGGDGSASERSFKFTIHSGMTADITVCVSPSTSGKTATLGLFEENGNVSNTSAVAAGATATVEWKGITEGTYYIAGKKGPSDGANCNIYYVGVNEKELVKTKLQSVTLSNVDDKTYTGEEIKPTIAVTDTNGESVEATGYTVTYARGTGNDGTTAPEDSAYVEDTDFDFTSAGTIFVKVEGKGLYDGKLAPVSYTIKKKALDKEQAAYGVDTTQAAEGATTIDCSIDLNELFGIAASETVTYSNPTIATADQNVLASDPQLSIEGTTLKFTSVASLADGTEAKPANIEITSDFANYTAIKLTVIIKLVEKTKLTFEGVTAPSKTYDGEAVAFDSASVVLKNGTETVTNVTLDVVFTAKDGTALDEAPVDAGEYVLIISVPETNMNYSGKLEVPFEITKKELQLKAADRNYIKGYGKTPDKIEQNSLYYNYTELNDALVGTTLNDLLKNVDINLAYKSGETEVTDWAAATVGELTIVPGMSIKTGDNVDTTVLDNYDVVPVNGKLTVLAEEAALADGVHELNLTKNWFVKGSGWVYGSADATVNTDGFFTVTAEPKSAGVSNGTPLMVYDKYTNVAKMKSAKNVSFTTTKANAKAEFIVVIPDGASVTVGSNTVSVSGSTITPVNGTTALEGTVVYPTKSTPVIKMVKAEVSLGAAGSYEISGDKEFQLLYVKVTDTEGGVIETVEAPTFDPTVSAGTTPFEYKFASKSGKVKLAAEADTTVYYVLSTDADKYAAFADEAAVSVYTTNGTEYTAAMHTAGGIAVTEGMTIKAVAVKGGKVSAVATSPVYKLGTIDNLAGTVTQTQDPAGEIKVGDTVKVTLSYSESGTTVKYLYTTDGTNPAPAQGDAAKVGSEYDAATGIVIPTQTAGTVTVKALAYTEGSDGTVTGVSEVQTSEYEVKSAQEQTYDITVVTNITGALVTAGSKTSAEAGETVNLSDVADVRPEKGYELKGWTVKTADNADVTVTNGTFTMPTSAVTVTPVIGSAGSTTVVKMPTAQPYDPNGYSFTADEKKKEVTLKAEDGVKIYYTTDGSDPTTASTEYTAPIAITAATTIKAIAVKDGESSDVLTAAYKILSADDVAAPVADPIPTEDYVAIGTKVKLSSKTKDAIIYYTTDGSTPTADSTKYDDKTPIEIQETTTIKAIAIKGEGTSAKQSEISIYIYYVDEPEYRNPDYTEEEVLLDQCRITVPSIVEGSKVSIPPTYVTYTDNKTHETVKFTEGIDYTVKQKEGAQNTLVLQGTGRDYENGRSVDGYTIPTESKKEVTYNILKKTEAKNKSKYIDVSKAKITLNKNEIKGLYYTGHAQEPSLDFSKASEYKALYDAGRLNIAYRNNINAGKATVIISVVPEPEDQKKDTQKSAGIETFDTGSSVEPGTETPPAADTSKVYYGAKTLTFSIKKAAIKKGNIKATATVAFNLPSGGIKYADWEDYTSEINWMNQYDGEGISFLRVVSNPTKTGQKGFLFRPNDDYKVTYKANLKAGKATITVKGAGNNLSGSYTQQVTIKDAYDLSKYEIAMTDQELTNACVYSPKGARLRYITVKPTGSESPVITLYEGEDYSAKYKYADRDKKAGTKVDVTKITGINGCKGTLKDQSVTIGTPKFANAVYYTGKKGLYDELDDNFYVDKNSKKGALEDLKKAVIVTDYSGAKLTLGKDYVIEEAAASAEETKPAEGTKPAKAKYVIKPSDAVKANYQTKASEADTADYGEQVNIPYIVGENLAKDKNFIFDKLLEKNDPLGYDGRNPVKITQDEIDKYINKIDKTKTEEEQDKARVYQLWENIEIVPGTYKNNVKKGTAQVTVRGTGYEYNGHTFYGTKVLKFKIVEK